MDQLIQFHIDNKYYVKVNSIPSAKGCTVSFPQNIFLNQQKINKTYIINNELNEIELYQKNQETKIIKVDKITIRLLILEDVLLNTIKRNLSTNLIVIENNENSTIFDIIDTKLNDEEVELEKKLCIMFRKMLIGQNKNTITNERLNDCFLQVLDCFENGGF